MKNKRSLQESHDALIEDVNRVINSIELVFDCLPKKVRPGMMAIIEALTEAVVNAENFSPAVEPSPATSTTAGSISKGAL